MDILTKIETRSEVKADEAIIEGYFALFNDETELFQGFKEQIDRKAFDNSLKSDVRALINHETDKVLGRTKAGTLELKTDEKGLYGKIIINQKDTDAVNLYERVKRGDINQCSIGFFIKEENIENLPDGTIRSTILDVELYEISCVTFPAYENTTIEARKRQIECQLQKELQLKKIKLKERLKK